MSCTSEASGGEQGLGRPQAVGTSPRHLQIARKGQDARRGPPPRFLESSCRLCAAAGASAALTKLETSIDKWEQGDNLQDEPDAAFRELETAPHAKNSESHWPAFHALHYHPCRCWPAPCSCLRTPSSQHPPDSQPQSTWRLPEDPNSRACRCAVAASPIDPDALGGAAPPSTGPTQQTAAATADTACHTAGAAPRKSTLLPLASHFLPCSARCSACTEPSCGCRGPKSSRAASP